MKFIYIYLNMNLLNYLKKTTVANKTKKLNKQQAHVEL